MPYYPSNDIRISGLLVVGENRLEYHYFPALYRLSYRKNNEVGKTVNVDFPFRFNVKPEQIEQFLKQYIQR